MRIEEFRTLIEARSVSRGLRVVFNPPASLERLQRVGGRLGVAFPSQVELFYLAHDGLVVQDPPLLVLSIERLEPGGVVHFATVDGRHKLGFDVRTLNAAGQWDIVDVDTGCCVTLTMASFWSNKIFAWIDKRRPIWQA